MGNLATSPFTSQGEGGGEGITLEILVKFLRSTNLAEEIKRFLFKKIVLKSVYAAL